MPTFLSIRSISHLFSERFIAPCCEKACTCQWILGIVCEGVRATRR